MPGLDGKQTCKELHKLKEEFGRGQNMKIIGNSAISKE